MKQCEATTLPSAYAARHRCLKKNGVRKFGRRLLCAHHRNMRTQPFPPVLL
ncbi:MAG: hypothetical protein AAB339_02205 [Elusimicrobiota bacterium]